jgi:Intracellular proteinase inhibitor
MKTNWLAIGIILLFVGIAIAPSINANNLRISLYNDLIVVVQTDKLNYQIGEPVEISIYVENRGETDIIVTFPTSQKADFWIGHSFLWSAGKFFIPMSFTITIPIGKRIYLLNDSWEQVDLGGDQVPPGQYSIHGWMVESYQYTEIHAEAVDIRIGSKIEINVHGGIGVTISMTDVGVFNITNMKGDISLKGGLFGFINLTESIDVENLVVNESISKTFHPVGFGSIKMEIIVSADNVEIRNLEGRMTVILFLVYPIIPPYKIIEEYQ